MSKIVRIKRPQVYRKMAQLWGTERSFTFLLIVLLVNIFIIIPFVHEDSLGRIVFAIFYFILLSSGLITVTKIRSYVAFVLVAVAVLFFSFSEILLKGIWAKLFSDLFYVLYCGALAAIVLVRTFDQGPITKQRIQGAIVAYLLISLIFCWLYHAIYVLYGKSAFLGIETFERYDFIYFSLTTLTTVGYGDISPVVTPARSLSNLEGLIGQLYPAILIARLVSMEFISSRKKDRKSDHDSQ
jgi:voltage-gated potassium channel Kch